VCCADWYKWARLLKQQSSITVYHLLTKRNNSIFRFRLQQQTEVGCFRFPLAENKRQLPFFR
jgi:hypothetical protein